MSSQLTKQEAQSQAIQQQSAAQGTRAVETQEHHAKASASAGLNLNILGALSGALSSASKKVTSTNADGSSTSTEDRHDRAAARGVAQGQGNLFASGEAEEGGKKTRSVEGVSETSQSQGRAVQVAGKKVDHLGLEG